jgi:hypothetical protein
MKDLNRKIGDKEFDGLITAIVPPTQVRAGTLAKLSSGAAVYKRGMLLSKNAAGKLVPLGTASTTPHSVLCDDIEVGAENDINVAVYTAGCFHPGKVTMLADHTITEGEMDNLRMRDIVFMKPHEAL